MKRLIAFVGLCLLLFCMSCSQNTAEVLRNRWVVLHVLSKKENNNYQAYILSYKSEDANTLSENIAPTRREANPISNRRLLLIPSIKEFDNQYEEGYEYLILARQLYNKSSGTVEYIWKETKNKIKA